MKKTIIAMLFLTMMIFSISCKKEEQLPAGKLTRENAFKTTQSIYPHSVLFAKTAVHGQQYLQNASSCKSCHGKNLEGGAVKISCNSCHSTYPHSNDFTKTTLHGTLFLADKNQCVKCHGNDYLGGNTKSSCLGCHDFPHRGKWAEANKHGAQFMANKGKSSACMNCHQNNADKKVTCHSCHSTYPHSENFAKTAMHGRQFLEDRNQCIKCHGNDYKGGNSKVTCLSCHDFPHVGNWALPNIHGTKFLLKNDDTKKSAGCLKCHQQNAEATISCNSCHSTYPHSREFVSTPLHGKTFIEGPSECIKCHGSDFKGGNTKVSCTKCHNFPHERNWSQPSKHGAEFLGGEEKMQECMSCHKENAKVTCNSCHSSYPHSETFVNTTLHGTNFLEDRGECIKCHGSDYSGGNTKVSCHDCHNFPHAKNWSNPEKHGLDFLKASARETNVSDPSKRKIAACMKCHQNNVNAAGTFKERHPEQFVSCSTCHADLPHGFKFRPFKEGQKETVSHASYVGSFPEIKGSCFSCHLNEKRSAPRPADSCINCHEGVPWPWEVPVEKT